MSILLYILMIVVLRVLSLQKYLISGKSLLLEVVGIVQFSILACVFLIVVLLNVICLVKLYFSPASQKENWKRKATTTVMILSVIYCVCNVGAVAVYGAENIWNYYSMPIELVDVSYFILLPLNSACNPVVYLMRKEEMRSHVRTLWGRLAGCMCRKEEQDITGVDNGARCDTNAVDAVTK